MTLTKTITLAHLTNAFAQPLGVRHIMDWTVRQHVVILTWQWHALLCVVRFDNVWATLLWESYQDASAAEYHASWGANGVRADVRHVFWAELRKQLRMRSYQETIGRLRCRIGGHPPSKVQMDEDGPRVYWACEQCGRGGSGSF